jgi:hypothetical protein
MNVRQAILSTADQIEKFPHTYSFYANSPDNNYGVGCLLGWIGRFAGLFGEPNCGVAGKVLGYPGGELAATGPFYAEIDDLLGDPLDKLEPKHAARGLRLYADKRYPAIPDSVRAIFNQQETTT